MIFRKEKPGVVLPSAEVKPAPRGVAGAGAETPRMAGRGRIKVGPSRLCIVFSHSCILVGVKVQLITISTSSPDLLLLKIYLHGLLHLF